MTGSVLWDAGTVVDNFANHSRSKLVVVVVKKQQPAQQTPHKEKPTSRERLFRPQSPALEEDVESVCDLKSDTQTSIYKKRSAHVTPEHSTHLLSVAPK